MEEDFYRMYLEEMGQIEPCSREEDATLLEKLKAGDESVRDRLVEGNLGFALDLAKEYEGRGLPINDLVQEANMALLLSIGTGMTGTFKELAASAIRKALEEAVCEQDTEREVEEAVLARVNVLKDIAQTMAEELGREAGVEELAERMKMTTEEIKEIMKLTLDAMSVPGE
ncbi:MAG: sigma-70 domain-containing protein [Hungatella sp.]